ncbi:DDE-type integrase/transposase/recombinase [Zunongwangia sp.]|uniref:DDE-type integrase/transposase/recombinase n=1 Tax=Zunongwangia sp. TaxID=1965325 RepID=UPI003AA86479
MYRLLGLQLRRKSKSTRIKTSLNQPQAPRQVLSADFISDGLITGRKFRVFNLIYDYNREVLCTTPALSIPALRAEEYLKQAIEIYGKPLQIRVDNGPEFISKIFMSYCETEGIEVNYI